MQIDPQLKPTLSKMQRILSDCPLMMTSYDALRLMLILTVLDDAETRTDALSATFGRSHARTLASWLATLPSSFSSLVLDANEYRSMILATMRNSASQVEVASDACDMAGLLSEEAEMIRDSLRLWLQTDEGRTHWRSTIFKNAVLLSLHIGETSTYCSTVLGNVCKTIVDETMQDDDLLIRLISKLSSNCDAYFTSLWTKM
jgi:hypothetical protein